MYSPNGKFELRLVCDPIAMYCNTSQKLVSESLFSRAKWSYDKALLPGVKFVAVCTITK